MGILALIGDGLRRTFAASKVLEEIVFDPGWLMPRDVGLRPARRAFHRGSGPTLYGRGRARDDESA
jgi:hypothetical protein